MPTTYSCPKQYKNPSADPCSFGLSLKVRDALVLFVHSYPTQFYDYGGDSPKPGDVKVFVGILDEEDAE